MSAHQFEFILFDLDGTFNYALTGSGVNDVSTAIMVGDRKHDILGAKENGLKSIGVLFGYGDRQELEEAGADYIAESVAGLRKILSHT